MPVYPGDPIVRVSTVATLPEDGYQVTALGLNSHTGTHIDAPRHVNPDGRTLDEYPIDRFQFAARRVDCTHVGAGECVEVADIERAIDADTGAADLLVLDTGWHEQWGDPGYFREYPALAPEAAALCADRGYDVAIDSASVDPLDGDLVAHDALLGADRLIVENLAAVTGLPEEFTLHGYPLSLVAADGAPVRAVAEW